MVPIGAPAKKLPDNLGPQAEEPKNDGDEEETLSAAEVDAQLEELKRKLAGS